MHLNNFFISKSTKENEPKTTKSKHISRQYLRKHKKHKPKNIVFGDLDSLMFCTCNLTNTIQGRCIAEIGSLLHFSAKPTNPGGKLTSTAQVKTQAS
jgi:hypothetical protein